MGATRRKEYSLGSSKDGGDIMGRNRQWERDVKQKERRGKRKAEVRKKETQQGRVKREGM
jgi:hypothetical protein